MGDDGVDAVGEGFDVLCVGVGGQEEEDEEEGPRISVDLGHCVKICI